MFGRSRLSGLLVAFATAVRAHDQAGHALGWAGAFAAPDRWYSLNLEKVGGRYSDTRLTVVLLSMAGEPSDEALHELAPEALSRINSSSCAELSTGFTLEPGLLSGADAGSGCYALRLDESWAACSFRIDNGAAHEHLAIFALHPPTQFAQPTAIASFVRDTLGRSVDMEATLDAQALEENHADYLYDQPVPGYEVAPPWGAAIGASLALCSATLSGVVLLGPGISHLARKHRQLFEIAIQSFAAGALLSAAFLLLILEGLHLTETGWVVEAQSAWRWGACVLAGFLVSGFIDLLVSLVSREKRDEPPAAERIAPDVDAGAMEAAEAKIEMVPTRKTSHCDPVDHAEPWPKRVRVLGGILIGDGLHNLCDGIFVGAAFLSCGTSFGWTVCLTSVAHELAQEVSDFIVLTSPHQGGLKPMLALVLNALSGLLSVVGVIITLSIGEFDQAAIGLLLSFGGGVYLHVGAAECMPRVYVLAQNTQLKLISLLSFVLGASAIGLVLLNHKHCDIDIDAHGATHAAHAR